MKVLIELKDSKQCKATMEVTECFLIVAEPRCCLPAEHAGMHRDVTGKYQWMTRDKLQRLMEEKGTSL